MNYKDLFDIITPMTLITLDGRDSGDRSDVSLTHNADTSSWDLILFKDGESTEVNFDESLIPDGTRRIALKCDGTTLDLFCDGIKIVTTTDIENLPESFLVCRPGQSYLGGSINNCNSLIGPIKICQIAKTDEELSETTTLQRDKDTSIFIDFHEEENPTNLYPGFEYVPYQGDDYLKLDIVKNDSTDLTEYNEHIENITFIIQPSSRLDIGPEFKHASTTEGPPKEIKSGVSY